MAEGQASFSSRSAYQVLSAVMTKEREAALQLALDALNEAEFEKENILSALGLLEEKRRHLVSRLADMLGCPEPAMNLTMISQRVGEPFAGRLQQIASELSALFKSLQAANQRNKQLFEHSRELLAGSLQLFGEAMAPTPTYSATGAYPNSAASGKCICDEI